MSQHGHLRSRSSSSSSSRIGCDDGEIVNSWSSNGDKENSSSSPTIFWNIVLVVVMIHVSVIMGIFLVVGLDKQRSEGFETSKLDTKVTTTQIDNNQQLFNDALSNEMIVKRMDHESLHWKDCVYNLNFSETTRRYSNEYHNYFNDGMMAPVIGKIECQEIGFFESYSNFKSTYFGMFYSKVVSFIDQVNVNLFIQDSHLFYPIISTYQVVSVEGNTYIDICGDVSILVSKLTDNGKNNLLKLFQGFNFTSCEKMFCNVNESIYDPFNLYFRAQNYSEVYNNRDNRSLFYRDLHILSILTNRCQYCKSERQFRVKVQNQECPFMVNFPARSAERTCMGKNGFAVFYPFMSLDQYLQTTGNPFMCYCYENSIYSSRCDSIHTIIHPVYQVIVNVYVELTFEFILFIGITFILVLPLMRDIYNRGRYFFKDFDLLLRSLSVIPFWIFRLIYCIIRLTVDITDNHAEDDKTGRFVNRLISIALDTVGFDYVFIPLVIKWNQTYQKIKLYTTENADLSRKRIYMSSIIIMIFNYTTSVGCGLVIIISFIVLKHVPYLFSEDGSSSEWLILIILFLIGIPILITLMEFFILSILIQRKLKQASDVSFVSSNYISTSRTYTLVSSAQFIPTLISALTLYFGYDSMLAALYFFSSTTMQVATDALEVYVVFILADRQSLKSFYYDLIWLKNLAPLFRMCIWGEKKQPSTSMISTSTCSTADVDDSDSYYTKMQ